ncbi:unnamed protein product [Darwinula stevensoni]|uniref:Uncharacterized protein n=1 Tax=Darwinula stevensoni TaxID=69355 RepID=A0A7R9FS49_9CRUS|nr:unnamed protein product [Darwinula stevensoni]CAG0902816.1 unnamed protein product [Darwinula stevensoni]
MASFRLIHNDRVQQLPGGVFSDVTFEDIRISFTSVQSVHPEALLPSKDRLRNLDINNSKLREFPYDIIAQFSNLTDLFLDATELTALSSFQSSSLEALVVGDHINYLGNLSLPNLKHLLLGFNPISKFPPGFFSSMENLQHFRAYYCSLGPTLTKGSLEFRGSSLYDIDIQGNSISNVEFDAITGFRESAWIDLSENEISVLREEPFRPILEKIREIDLNDNPVVCDCTMAWIVLNPEFLAKVKGSCTDGTDFQDLDPIDFQNCLDRFP